MSASQGVILDEPQRKRKNYFQEILLRGEFVDAGIHAYSLLTELLNLLDYPLADEISAPTSGRLAQGESASLTRKRPQVQIL